MQINVWVVNTCNPESTDPCLPRVFGTRPEADAYFEEMMRAEWAANTPYDDEGEPKPYPGDPDEAHAALAAAWGYEWGKWEITGPHEVCAA